MSFDLLHNIYLGTGRDLVASGMLTLIEQGVYDDTGLTELDDILCHIQQRIDAKCRAHKCLHTVRHHFARLILSNMMLTNIACM